MKNRSIPSQQQQATSSETTLGRDEIAERATALLAREITAEDQNRLVGEFVAETREAGR